MDAGAFLFTATRATNGQSSTPMPGKMADAGSIVANFRKGRKMELTDNENLVSGDVDLEATGNEDDTAGGQLVASQDAAGNQDTRLNAAITMANAEKEKRQSAEAEARAAKEQIAILAAYPRQNTQAQQKSLYVQLAERRGIDPEYPSAEENGLIMQDMLQLNNVQNEQVSFMSSHPDYSEVVGTSLANGGFNIAPPLKRVIANNPALASKLAGLDPAVIYQLAVTDPTYQKELAESAKPSVIKAAEKAEAAIKAATKKASIGSAGGGGSIDKTSEIAGWTDEQLDAHIEKIKSEA